MRAISLVLVAALAAPALAADRSQAERALKDAAAAGNAEGVQTACDELIECGGKESLDAILALLPKVSNQIYWQLASAAGGFKDAPALEELGKQIVSHQGDKSGISRDLLFGLQNNRSSGVTQPLAHVLEKASYDLKLMAIDQLGLLRSVDSVDALIASYKREEKGDEELKKRLETALHALTGESFGDAANWEGWWKKQRPQGVPAPKTAGPAAGGTMEKPRDNEWHGTIDKLGEGRIVVLAGCYDSTENILERAKIPHTLAKRREFDADPQKYLKDCWCLLINCDDCYEEKAPGVTGSGGKRLSDATLQAVKKWVEQSGGYLFTEDWGLIDITSVLWPDKIATLDGKAIPPMIEPEQTVKLTPVKGATSHPLMRGVWQKPRPANEPKPQDGKTVEKKESPAEPINHKWQIDLLSAAIKIVDTQNVIPLLESEELATQKNGTATVACTFRVGTWNPPHKTATGGGGGPKTQEFTSYARGGRVLHTISHYGKQSGSDDGQALSNMLINFMLEAVKHHSTN
jgi:hypothetical protein